MTVNILMCIYNGERFLREQIDSIMGQTYKDFCLFIRDDGSSDSTVKIALEYAAKYPGKVVLMDSPEHLGYPDCFWDILKRCPRADLYAFSDQDDVWDDRKLERAVRAFSEDQGEREIEPESDHVGSAMGQKKALPVLFIHDYDNCSGSLKFMSHHRLGDVSVLTDRSILFYTYASGFCMVINNAMRDMLGAMDLMGHGMYHDELCIWLAHFHGRILYDDESLTKYRRHESTVTEYGNGVFTLISNWLRREILGPEFGYKCQRIRTFLKMDKALGDKVNGRMSGKIRRNWFLLSGGNMTLARYFKRLMYPRRLRPSLGGELALRLMFLLGRTGKD